MRPQDSVLGGEIFVLKQKFLVDQARHISQQPSPLIASHISTIMPRLYLNNLRVF
jgi:hypothetical protein